MHLRLNHQHQSQYRRSFYVHYPRSITDTTSITMYIFIPGLFIMSELISRSPHNHPHPHHITTLLSLSIIIIIRTNLKPLSLSSSFLSSCDNHHIIISLHSLVVNNNHNTNNTAVRVNSLHHDVDTMQSHYHIYSYGRLIYALGDEALQSISCHDDPCTPP